MLTLSCVTFLCLYDRNVRGFEVVLPLCSPELQLKSSKFTSLVEVVS